VTVMSVVRNDRLEVLEYLKRSVGRMRRLAAEHPGRFAEELLAVADEIAEDVARLEGELAAAGHLPIPANQP